MDRSEGGDVPPGAEAGGLDRTMVPLRRQQGGVCCYQALRLFDAARANTSYTVVDSTAALRRAQTDRTGPGQAFASIIEVAMTQGSQMLGHTTVDAIHRGVEGNEVASMPRWWQRVRRTQPTGST